MCLQCCVEAEYIHPKKRRILPGFSLMIATKEYAKEGTPREEQEWPLGAYGLVECNDPTFVLDCPIVRDPHEGMSDDELEGLDSNQFMQDEKPYWEAINKMEIGLYADVLAGYRLIKAARKVGYKQDIDGRFACWLMKRIADYLA